jgi:hypothetical protein
MTQRHSQQAEKPATLGWPGEGHDLQFDHLHTFSLISVMGGPMWRGGISTTRWT